MLENLFNSPFLTSLALALLHFLWQGLLVATVLKSALLIIHNDKPQLRYALSALAMLINLLLPIITFILIYHTEVSSVNAIINSFTLSEFIQELQQPEALFSYTALTELLPSFLPYLAILWLSTITLLAGKLLIEITTVNKLPQQGALAPSKQLQARFEELVAQIQLTITPRLFISLKVEVPMAIGFLKPVVLIPASMISGLSAAQLEMLILHELAHIRRHDYLVNFLQTLVEILLFFHPAVLWVSKQMRNEREYCSDDIAVHHCGDAIAYAHTLADTASLCTKTHNHTIPDMAMAASGGDLKQRVIRLVDHHCAPKNNLSNWLASATIIFSVLLLSSKQLLTLPLLDIWHSKNPWERANQSVNVTEETKVHTETFTNELPSTSIAQHLPTPHQLTSQKKAQVEQSPLTEIVLAETDQSIKSPVFASTPEKTAESNKANNKHTISNETSLFDEQLDSLSAKTSLQSKNAIDSPAEADSLMVEAAFERTNSKNPYQKELALLATPMTEKMTTAEKSITHQQNSFDNSKPKSPELASTNTHDNAKTSAVSKYTPIWQDAFQLRSVDPVYPSAAKRQGIEIEVEVNFTIDVDGQIKDIKFAHHSKINYFKSAIRSAIKKWSFLPATVDDKPVESYMSKVFSFSLKG